MKNLSVKQYHESNYKQWNAFIGQAKNATFLFHRDFMEYHKERFEDYSLLVFDENHRLQALVPANISNQHVFSHQGLTYGGLVFSKKNKAEETEQMVQLLLDYLTADSVKKIIVKLLPSLYNQLATNDFDYFIYQKGGVLFRRDMNLAINLKCELQISKSKLKWVSHKAVVRLKLSRKENTKTNTSIISSI